MFVVRKLSNKKKKNVNIKFMDILHKLLRNKVCPKKFQSLQKDA